MICQKCGKSEVSFHYTSRINGSVTEAHLCADCARESGYALRSPFDMGGIFDSGGFFDNFFAPFAPGAGSFPLTSPARVSTEDPFSGFSAVFPFAALPWVLIQPGVQPETLRFAQSETSSNGRVCGDDCEVPAREAQPSACVDAEMQKRREINIMREQMRVAAKNEDFEKAAEYRDKIREMDGGNVK